jgi:NAD(P)-dependent dehydrogenase (short-subunit alcohol dehydrogenase family)
MINPMNMTGRCIVVTGASSGLGRETAICLSQLGSRVILVARDFEKLERTAVILEGVGHGIEPFDLSNCDGVSLWMKGLVKRHGLIDGVVHAAGVQLTRPIKDWRMSDCEKLMNINLNACFALAKGFRQKGVHRVGGSIVFLSSVAGLVGEIGLSIYTASKSAIIGITRSLAVELVRDGIRVNAVAPGFVHTEMVEGLLGSMPPEYLETLAAKHPLGLGKPIDVAHAVVFLLADTGRWITGTTLVVDGGYTA